MENNKYFLPISVIAAGLLIAGAVVWNGSNPAGNTATQDGKVVVNIKNVKTAGNPFIGKENAPVTIAFWSDFQCPYCKAFEVGGVPQITTPAAFPQILKNYVDTGKAKVVFMDFAFLGDDSITAAQYSRAVWKLYPAQYFDWRTAVMVAQDQEHGGFGNAASIDALSAKIAGIDATKLAADVEANASTYNTMIEADKAEAGKVGVQATPSFVIGTEVIGGAYPFARFQTAIDALLK
jgi:protein-disulfide isomerase